MATFQGSWDWEVKECLAIQELALSHEHAFHDISCIQRLQHGPGPLNKWIIWIFKLILHL